MTKRDAVNDAIEIARDALLAALSGVIEEGGIAIVVVQDDGTVSVGGNLDARGTEQVLKMGAERMATVS